MDKITIELTNNELDILLQALSIAEDEAGSWVDPNNALSSKLEAAKVNTI